MSNDLAREQKDAQRKVNLADDLKKLQSNRSFSKLIERHYMRDYVAEQTMLLADPRLSMDERQEVRMNLDAVSRFNQFLTGVQEAGVQGERDLKNIQDYTERQADSGDEDEDNDQDEE